MVVVAVAVLQTDKTRFVIAGCLARKGTMRAWGELDSKILRFSNKRVWKMRGVGSKES